MRVFVTGASGFVGRYVVAAFGAAGYDVHESGGLNPLDIRDAHAVTAAMRDAAPDVIVHLAAQTFVPRSLEAPQETFDTNVGGTRIVAEAAAALPARPRLIFASSAEVYGAVDAAALPIRESQPRNPLNPYARSKAQAEDVLRQYADRLDTVIVRSFNAIGPGQDERFVVSSFAHQLARIACGADPVMHVGNLDAKRDFLDVRDAAAAYVALAEHGRPGAVYNVCSGTAHPIRDVLRELILAARVPVEVRQDPARMRPSDIPLFVGSNEALRATGWSPSFTLRATVRNTYEAALQSVEKERQL